MERDDKVKETVEEEVIRCFFSTGESEGGADLDAEPDLVRVTAERPTTVRP